MRKIAMLAAVSVVAVFLAGAAPAQVKETDQDIYNRIKTLLDDKRVLAAAREAVRMEPYKDSEFYNKASKLLLKYDISIGDPLKSYTVKQIIDLENHEERKRAATGDIPSPGTRPKYTDAWDTPLRVEMMSRPNIAYVVRSAGPDRLFMSNDDLLIAVRDKPIPAKRGGVKRKQAGVEMYQLTPEDMLRQKGKRSMMRGQNAPGGGGGGTGLPGSSGYGGGSGGGGSSGSQGPQPNETSVSVDDLLKK